MMTSKEEISLGSHVVAKAMPQQKIDRHGNNTNV